MAFLFRVLSAVHSVCCTHGKVLTVRTLCYEWVQRKPDYTPSTHKANSVLRHPPSSTCVLTIIVSKQRLRVVVSLCKRRSVSGHTFYSNLLTTINVAPVAPTVLTDLGMVMSDRRIDDQLFICRNTAFNEYRQFAYLNSVPCSVYMSD